MPSRTAGARASRASSRMPSVPVAGRRAASVFASSRQVKHTSSFPGWLAATQECGIAWMAKVSHGSPLLSCQRQSQCQCHLAETGRQQMPVVLWLPKLLRRLVRLQATLQQCCVSCGAPWAAHWWPWRLPTPLGVGLMAATRHQPRCCWSGCCLRPWQGLRPLQERRAPQTWEEDCGQPNGTRSLPRAPERPPAARGLFHLTTGWAPRSGFFSAWSRSGAGVFTPSLVQARLVGAQRGDSSVEARRYVKTCLC
mmetsp:Transcript_41576/g.115683  ORF Transcript_41576/g.115683 Transcript_41576/m.115683 type:complete len:253 (-) Transcript_41576:8-766(-)